MPTLPVARLVRPLALASLGAIASCDLAANALTLAPYAQGLTWTASEQATTTTVAFKATPSGGVVESTGTVGFGASCGTARASAGTLTVTGLEEVAHVNQVLGNTVADHPLNPGEDVFSRIGISVVSEQTTTTGSTQRVETFNRPDDEVRSWEERSAGDAGRQTRARFHGVAADEFLVSMFPLDLWDPTDNYVGAGRPEAGDRRLALLTRHLPRPGDTWQSLDGGTIYVFDGKERLNVGGRGVLADRVAVFANEDYDASDVLGTCLKVGPLEDTTTFPEGDSVVTEAVILDGGCEGAFQRQQIGTEWWYGGVLVKFEGTRTFVEIQDFGWEWFDDGEGGCVRFTSTAKPVDVADAELFVEYTVTTRDALFVVETWDVVDVTAEAE